MSVFDQLMPRISDGDSTSARFTAWQIKVQGLDITDTIKKDLISISITDNEEDEADDLQIKVADREAVWLQKWLDPAIYAGAKSKGLLFELSFGSKILSGKYAEQKAGTFELDSVKSNGPPASVTMKCTSCPFTGGIRTEDRTKSWENYNISGIGQEIASKAGLTLLFESSDNPTISRIEQDEETDIAFLKRVAQMYGFSLKISSGYLILFKKADFEKNSAVRTFTYGSGEVTSWDFSTTSGDTEYNYCTVSYGGISGTYYDESYETPEEGEEDKNLLLSINHIAVSSQGEAESIAEQQLKLKNRFERTVTLNVPGDPTLMAGLNVELKDCGYWNGKYMIKRATHNISKSGFTTKIELRKI